MNLVKTIEKTLPAELHRLMRRACTLAASRGVPIYLVGGAVRDMLLGLPSLDLDLVVEGDAIKIGNELARQTGGKLTTHTRFNTASLVVGDWRLDLVTARAETYARPGTLPTVRSGTIRDDLARRDFTVNALAVNLTPAHDGELVDIYGGLGDLKKKTVRVLHDKSFIDDATRIWRAIRYEQRLGFLIEPATLKLIKRDNDYLSTISGDRIRHELEAVLREAEPERMLRRAWVLRVLRHIHPALRGDAWLRARFARARQIAPAGHPLQDLYVALLTLRLTESDVEQAIGFLRPARHVAVILREACQLRAGLGGLASRDMTPAQVYSVLHGYSQTAILANLIAGGTAAVRVRIRQYLDKLRYIKPALTGGDLKTMGMAPGPRIQQVLDALLDARLNGTVRTRKQEEALVREWLKTRKNDSQEAF